MSNDNKKRIKMVKMENIADWELFAYEDRIIVSMDSGRYSPIEHQIFHADFEKFLTDQMIIGEIYEDSTDAMGEYVGSELTFLYQDYLAESFNLLDMIDFMNKNSHLLINVS